MMKDSESLVTKAHAVPYESRFGVDVPVAGFPLPLPVALPEEIRVKWWTDLLTYAEAYVQRPREKLTSIPKKFWNIPKKNKVVSALAAEIVVGMEFYATWTVRTSKDDYKDIDAPGLAKSAKDDVLRAVGIARSGDWPQFVVGEYLDALQRCRALCDATRRGHLAEVGEPLSFRKEDVEKTMGESHGFVGVIDYDHIRAILLLETALYR